MDELTKQEKRLEELTKTIQKGNQAKELVESGGWELLRELLDEEVSYYVNKITDPSTTPREFVAYRAEINARRGLKNKLEMLLTMRKKAVTERALIENHG